MKRKVYNYIRKSTREYIEIAKELEKTINELKQYKSLFLIAIILSLIITIIIKLVFI